MSRSHKLRLFGTTLVLGTFGFLIACAVDGPASSRSEQWKKVQVAVDKGLPKSAIKELDPIIESALKEKAYPEAIKAIGKKIALEANIEGNKPEERITRLKAEIAKAPKEMVPVMDAILAHWYWHYFQQNRYRFYNRTVTDAPPSEDFTTWDLSRLFAEIDKQFTKSLSAEKELKATPIQAYDALLEKGTVPDAYRPTLYDFVAYDALQFYNSGEQAASKAEDAFELTADSPIFSSVAEFLKWTPQTTDTESPKLKAIKLYQSLLTFHPQGKDQTPFLDADLARLQFGNSFATGDEKSARYLSALKQFSEQYATHELSATARFRWASLLHGEGKSVEARTIALQAKNAFPNSNGGKQCHNLITGIEAKELSVATERVWNDPLPKIRVTYRNIAKVHFRAVKVDWASRLTRERWRPEHLNTTDYKDLVNLKPELEWAVELPATTDFLSRTEDQLAPKGLKPGFYFLLASPEANFGDKNNIVSTADVWVSDLALVIRNAWGHARLEGFVLAAKTGEPIAEASVKTWVRNNDGTSQPGPSSKTDKNGLFDLHDLPNNKSYFVLAEHNGQSLVAQNEVSIYNHQNQPRPFTQTVLFTDRALYRPGQIVSYKGICLFADQQGAEYKIQAGRSVEVIFKDRNGKEIAKHQTKSNDFGSFSGSFTTPRDRITGQMFIQVPGDGGGAVYFNVEEYKRPKFVVTLDAPKEAPKLNGNVTVIGKAVGYTGAAINGAKVKYRVTREVRWPSWFYEYCFWRLPPNRGAAQEIAHGTATTEGDGSFKINFIAKPDVTVPEKDEPTFHYAVHADVTDTTGETRSGNQSVAVSYTALQANLSADDWQTNDQPVKIKLVTSTLDGEGQAAKGTIKIHKLKAPETVQRPDILSSYYQPRRGKGSATPRPDSNDPRTWELDEVMSTTNFVTLKDGKTDISVKLNPGIFRAILETQDRFGKPVNAQLQFKVLQPNSAKFGIKIPNLLAGPKWSLEPGEEFVALWGTGYDQGRAFVEIEHQGKTLQSFWTDANKTQVSVKQPITEALRGGFTIRTTFVRENRGYLENRHVNVPWTNKDLTVKWERFVSKLEPGKKETYTAVISGPKATKVAAEMVATLYDASLDAYRQHSWNSKFNVFRSDYSNLSSQFENSVRVLYHFRGSWNPIYQHIDWRYRSFPADLTVNLWSYGYFGEGRNGMPVPASAPGNFYREGAAKEEQLKAGADRGLAEMDAAGKRDERELKAPSETRRNQLGEGGGPGQVSGPDLSKVAARKNLNETAFFFPHLTSDANGTIRMEFTMPEALTKWKFMGFAHGKDLTSGYLQDDVVTAKDLMVQPNPPRFLREGDILEFSVKVSNQSPTKQVGKVQLKLNDLRTNASIDTAIGNATPEQSFDIPAGESRSFFWKLTIPDGQGPITYKTVGATERLSDGEEGVLPVLSRRILVTESMSLPVRGMQTKTFDFAKLSASGKSETLKSQSLTVQMVSQPAWYAVMALPYLMESPHECSEQVFNRLYANSLARHIAVGDPKIRRIFDQWKNTPALDSPLQKNQDLKSVMIEETPWLQDANKEAEARRNVGVLFDDNRLNEETARQLRKLSDMQTGEGMWPWFPGGPGNEYMTLYITTGFGRLRHLGVKVDQAPAIKSLTRLDAWADRIYRDILKHAKNKDDNHLSSTIALYLYGRSFFLQDKAVAKEHDEAVTYWLGQAKKYWLSLANRQSQAHIAIGLKRFGDKETPKEILASLKERSVSNEELGMFWRDTELSSWWYHAPIETQALMVEAFDEIANDAAAVEDLKVWLLKQKQTQNWKTTKATSDAVYALLLRGDNLLKSDALVEVTLGAEKIKPENVEAGTGFYEQKFLRGEVKPELGKITVKKTDAGVSWGSVHWQYLEDISKVTPHDGTPLKLEKKLFKRTLTKKGPVLEAVNGPLNVGDEVVVRVVLRTDRDMEYVHLKDHRGSGTEPTNVLSRYRYQDGLGYYESTKDTASHFFIDYLPKGTYVFEYTVQIQHKGKYPTGLASIQSMYAPEFNAHSESIPLEVK